MLYQGAQHKISRVRIQSSEKLSASSRRMRIWAILGGALVWSSLLVWRLYSLQISNFETWQDWALKQHFMEVRLASERGPIYDREGKLLAASVPAGSIYVRPHQVKDKKSTVEQISKLLSIKPKEVEEDLAVEQPFVWIQRQIPRAVAEKVAALKLPGVGFVLESRRVYPYNNAASSLIGKVGVDGMGLSGIEAVYEKRLRGEQVKTRMVRDAFGNMIDVSVQHHDEFEPPRGTSMQLTIDADLQIIVDEELEAGRLAANADRAMAVMIDADTGEILSMSQAPSTNFNMTKLNPKKDLKNLSVETVFEPGSIFKPLVAAAAIEAGLANPNEMINCEHGVYPFGSHRIRDVHPSDTISFHDVVVRSSNIGMTKIGMRLGADKLYDYLKKLGFGDPSLNILPGETRGILRPVENWSRVDVATHSFGQGVAVTPLQIVRATAAIANGGILPTLKVINDGKAAPSRRVFSEATAEKVRDMMYGVVTEEHGTGKNADIPGVKVGGKTGTAQKARQDGRGYKAGAYMSSFVGFVDGAVLGVDKKLALIVIVDEPHAKSIYGGVLAAPVFKRIMQRTLHYLTTKEGLNPEFGADRREFIAEAKTPTLTTVSYSK